MATEIHKNNGGHYCGECGVPVCEHVAALHPTGPIFSAEEVGGLKTIIRSNVKWSDVYKGGAYLDYSAAFASRLLRKVGINTKLEERSGKVTFEESGP